MPPTARLHAPGTLVHVIARIINREFLIDGPDERHAYLARIPVALKHCDWIPIAFGLMSNHVHLALIAGRTAPFRFFQGLHRSFAGWMNRAHGRLGPVFAGRPKTIYMPLERTPILVSYIHNNPVRARLVGAADETDWSSHRMWVGADAAAPWLDVARGLSLAGFTEDHEGRRHFDGLVNARAIDPRDPDLCGDSHAADRREARSRLALPVELSSPFTDSANEYQLCYLGSPPMEPRWSGDLARLIELVARYTGIPSEAIRSRCHSAGIVRARRLACVVGVVGLRRTVREVAAELGLSDSAVSRHLRKLDGRVISAAREVEKTIRELPEATTA